MKSSLSLGSTVPPANTTSINDQAMGPFVYILYSNSKYQQTQRHIQPSVITQNDTPRSALKWNVI